MAITISEIAKLANVSKTTVSYVLNGKGNIPASTRDKVLKIMQEHDYQPNNNARNLSIGKNLRVGIFIPGTEYLRRSVFFLELSSSILPIINKHGIDLVVETYSDKREEWLRNFAGLDGAILINPGNDEAYIQWLRSAKIPVIVVGRPSDADDLYFVDGPNAEMASAMTQKVIDCGHTKLLYILPDQRYTLTEDFMSGIRRVIDQYGDRVSASCFHTSYGEDIGENWLRAALESAPDTTAVFVDSDYKAVRVQVLLQKMGKRVPEDISLVCLSGSYLTQMPTPQICSSNQDVAILGEYTASALVDLINGVPHERSRIMTEYHIQEGESLQRITGETI